MKSEMVWFITGCSTGFGRELAHQVLAQGSRVVITARNPKTLSAEVEKHGDRALVLELDVTDDAMIRKSIADAEAHFGHIDVLVNNAGYGYFSAIEEGEDVEIRRQFETNVFGLFSLTRYALPRMRARRRGHIVNVSSIGGFMGFAATGYYHATKFAVEGFSESLAAEVAPLGIHVTVVEPGRFRTDWAGRSVIESKSIIDDYAETAGKRRAQAKAYSGTQPGDPSKAATAIIRAVEAEVPPFRLALGSDAYQLIGAKLDDMQTNLERWKEQTLSTDFTSAPAQ
jgi:NAD(P)-dependent dehydrogenase (short-subunit alcohol dehydrogenase family)